MSTKSREAIRSNLERAIAPPTSARKRGANLDGLLDEYALPEAPQVRVSEVLQSVSLPVAPTSDGGATIRGDRRGDPWQNFRPLPRALPSQHEEEFCVRLFLVPLHLKAMDEGSLRRQLASRVLAAAVIKMIHDGEDADWVLGGDVNAPLASGDFDQLSNAGLVAVSQQDADAGAISYIKGPKSLIDHIYLSPNLAAQFDKDKFPRSSRSSPPKKRYRTM